MHYASLRLVRDAIGPGQRFRRHVPPLVFLLAMAAALVALARPSAVFLLPSQSQTIVLAMDVSRSMRAKDVDPNRITAAQAAAKDFIEQMPNNLRVGIVTFAGTASIVQTPTENRDDLIAAIDRFQLQRATADRQRPIMSLSLLLPDSGIDLESMVFDRNFSRFGGGAAGIDRPRRLEKAEKKDFTPVAPGSVQVRRDHPHERRPAHDRPRSDRGGEDGGRSRRARLHGRLRHQGGRDDRFRRVVGVRDARRGDAKAGREDHRREYYHAGTAADLKKVYQTLNSKLALEQRDTEMSALFSALAALLAFCAAGLSLLWFHRG